MKVYKYRGLFIRFKTNETSFAISEKMASLPQMIIIKRVRTYHSYRSLYIIMLAAGNDWPEYV